MDCPKCNKPLHEKIRTVITDKDLQKPYFFSQWYVCRCGYVKLSEKYKIYNRTSSRFQRKLEDNIISETYKPRDMLQRLWNA
jgi:hypothetical protein